ncbi:MAG: dienelactone hydrolase family protein [Acidobacteria bacterium]|nr:MAG: dienelactone hydrolase family protein [Acidobacteriota bacterium]
MERKQASDYPQELLDLFHEFQHGEIDRREFFARAQKFAVGGLTVAAIFETMRPNYAWAQQVPKDDARLTTSYETVPSPAGNGSIRGYFAKPKNATGKLPAVLVIHENRGLNPYIEDVARRAAAANFVAFAPDGNTSVGPFTNDEEGAVKFRQVNGPKMFEDFVASFDWLKARPESNGKVGVVGFCFGGGIVNQLAVRKGADMAAGVPFYGRQPNAEDTAKIKAQLLIHYAGTDGVTNTWPTWEAALKAAGVKYEGFVYEGTVHGFHNDTTPRYNEAAAKLAWTRTIEFFNKTLR